MHATLKWFEKISIICCLNCSTHRSMSGFKLISGAANIFCICLCSKYFSLTENIFEVFVFDRFTLTVKLSYLDVIKISRILKIIIIQRKRQLFWNMLFSLLFIFTLQQTLHILTRNKVICILLDKVNPRLIL